MCDYSLEGYPSVKATAGEKYVMNQSAGGMHGFTPRNKPTVAACVAHGQMLELSGIVFHREFRKGGNRHNIVADLGTTETVTVVSMKELPAAERRKIQETVPFGPHNDGVRFRNGTVLAIAYILDASMEVAAPKPKAKRDLGELLGLTKAKPKRESVDAD